MRLNRLFALLLSLAVFLFALCLLPKKSGDVETISESKTFKPSLSEDSKSREQGISLLDCSEIKSATSAEKALSDFYLQNSLHEDVGRSRYGLGSSQKLDGRVTVALFFVSDEKSSWQESEIDAFTEERILPALSYLVGQGQAWGVTVDFQVLRFSPLSCDKSKLSYRGSINPDLTVGGSTKDVMSQIAENFGFRSDLELRFALKENYDASDEIVPLVFVNQRGTSFARPQISGTVADYWEHAIIFSDGLHDPLGFWKLSRAKIATIAHEILHLFGAEDFYSPQSRLELAERYFIDDIMLLDSYDVDRLWVRELSAYQIGWSSLPHSIVLEPAWN